VSTDTGFVTVESSLVVSSVAFGVSVEQEARILTKSAAKIKFFIFKKFLFVKK
jgi:hypothetical protein